jgi:hypothetical protein
MDVTYIPMARGFVYLAVVPVDQIRCVNGSPAIRASSSTSRQLPARGSTPSEGFFAKLNKADSNAGYSDPLSISGQPLTASSPGPIMDGNPKQNRRRGQTGAPSVRFLPWFSRRNRSLSACTN